MESQTKQRKKLHYQLKQSFWRKIIIKCNNSFLIYCMNFNILRLEIETLLIKTILLQNIKIKIITIKCNNSYLIYWMNFNILRQEIWVFYKNNN